MVERGYDSKCRLVSIMAAQPCIGEAILKGGKTEVANNKANVVGYFLDMRFRYVTRAIENRLDRPKDALWMIAVRP